MPNPFATIVPPSPPFKEEKNRTSPLLDDPLLDEKNNGQRTGRKDVGWRADKGYRAVGQSGGRIDGPGGPSKR